MCITYSISIYLCSTTIWYANVYFIPPRASPNHILEFRKTLGTRIYNLLSRSAILACFSRAVHFRMMAQTVILSVLIELLLTFTFNVSGSKVMFSNTWAVKIRDGGVVVVGNLARKHGFVNETQVLSTSYNCKLFI